MIKDETGIALPLVIFVILALSLLGIILFNYNMAETTQVARDEHRLKAHYLARSGAHVLASHLVQNQDLAKELRDYMYKGDSHYLESFSKEVELGDGRYQVKAEYLGENAEGEGEIYITSIGRYGNARQSIGLTIKIQGISAAVTASSISNSPTTSLSIENGDFLYIGEDELEQSVIDTLNNDVLEEGFEVRFGSHDFDEVIFPWEDGKVDMFTQDPRDWEINDWDFFDEVNYNDNQKLTINTYEKLRYDFENNQGVKVFRHRDDLEITAIGDNNHILFYADNIDMRNNDITVRLGNNNVVAIVVYDEFDALGDLTVKKHEDADEGGFLLLYVKDFELGGNSEIIIQDEDDVHVNMYVFRNGKVDLGGTSRFVGSIYGPHSDYIIAGDTGIEGWIIAGDVEFRGGSGQSENKPSDIVFYDVKMFETSINLETVNMDTWHDTE